jgi:hypothetical protein
MIEYDAVSVYICGSVSKMVSLRARRPGFDFRQTQEIPLRLCVRTSIGPFNPLSSRYRGLFFLKIKLPGRKLAVVLRLVPMPRMYGAIPPPPIYTRKVMHSRLKYRNKLYLPWYDRVPFSSLDNVWNKRRFSMEGGMLLCMSTSKFGTWQIIWAGLLYRILVC